MWLLSIGVHLLSKHNQEGGKAVKNLINLTIQFVPFQVERLGTWAGNKYLHTVIVNNYNFTANILEDQTGKENCKILINIIFSIVLTNAGINVLILRISKFRSLTFPMVRMSNSPANERSPVHIASWYLSELVNKKVGQWIVSIFRQDQYCVFPLNTSYPHYSYRVSQKKALITRPLHFVVVWGRETKPSACNNLNIFQPQSRVRVSPLTGSNYIHLLPPPLR